VRRVSHRGHVVEWVLNSAVGAARPEMPRGNSVSKRLYYLVSKRPPGFRSHDSSAPTKKGKALPKSLKPPALQAAKRGPDL